MIRRISPGPDRALGRLQGLLRNRELTGVLIRHAYRGVRMQFLLRSLLIVSLALGYALVPPNHDRPAGIAVLVAYAAWAAGLAWWVRRRETNPLRWVWLALLVDSAAVTGLTVVAGASARQTWTADLVVNGFFLLPVLAATQLRPRVTAATSGLALIAYGAASAATKAANTEPWGSIVTRVLILGVVCVGCVGLSWIQLSRVVVIGELLDMRTELLDQLTGLEERERSALAEQLHDGALQYVLAARMDLDDLRSGPDVRALDRLDHALRESSDLLRNVVTELHPAVLRQAGLARAVEDLVSAAGTRGDLTVTVDTTGWGDQPTTNDRLLYGCARELFVNVVKHAAATRMDVTLTRDDRRAELVVRDDGVGARPQERHRRLAEGHVGLASLDTRVAAAGGEMTITSPVLGARGTQVVIAVPID